VTIVDDANSGTTLATTLEAAAYARRIAGDPALTLIIGEENSTVCEGFSDADVHEAIRRIGPGQVILIGKEGEYHHAPRIAEALERARALTPKGSIVVAVKTWR
jgi:regulator of RNase E activity RraA